MGAPWTHAACLAGADDARRIRPTADDDDETRVTPKNVTSLL